MLSHTRRHLLAIAGEHDDAFHAQLLQRGDSLGAIGFHLVGDDDMAGILAIDSHMDDGSCTSAVVPLRPDGVHHLRVAHANQVVAHTGTNALSGHFFHVGHLATIGSFVGERVTQSCTNGMG